MGAGARLPNDSDDHRGRIMYLANCYFLHSDPEPESQADHDVNIWPISIAEHEKSTAQTPRICSS